MKNKLFAIFVTATMIAISGLLRAQILCLVNPLPLPDSNYLAVDCFVSTTCRPDLNAGDPCDLDSLCIQIRIRNMYPSKKITSVEFSEGDALGAPYKVCSASQHEDGQDTSACQDVAWGFVPGITPSQEFVNPCWVGQGTSDWFVKPNANGPCPGGAAFGWWIYIDLCMFHDCDKITWTVHFSDGSSCDIKPSLMGMACCTVG